MCREEAKALSSLLAETRGLSRLRLVAVLKESRINKDGSSEAEAFLKYYPGGELYIDEKKEIYQALGTRSFVSLISLQGIAYIRQRLSGIGQNSVKGNFNGVGSDPLLLGGIFLLTPSGRVVWTHPEGNGPIPYNELSDKLSAFADDKYKEPEQQDDWLKVVSNWFR